jgi:hypothetical protein
MKKLILLVILTLLSCHPSYTMTMTGNISSTMSKAPNCDFVIVTSKVEKDYEEIAILDAYVRLSTINQQKKTDL